MKKFIVPAVSLLTIVAGYLCLEGHESHSLERDEFSINAPFIAVVKGLATKNSLEKIVEEGEGAVTGKNWENFRVEVPRRILKFREYGIEGELRFNVEKTDPDLGRLKLPFVQQISLEDQVLLLTTSLESPQGQVLSCERKVEISPSVDADGPIHGTHVSIVSELKVRKTIPFFFRETMDQKVAQSNRKDLERLKNNIINASGHKPILTVVRKAN